MASLAELARTGELVDDVSHTLAMTLIATVTALIFGAVLGLALGLLPTMRNYVVASIDFLRAIPAVTLIPVAMISLGPSVADRVHSRGLCRAVAGRAVYGRGCGGDTPTPVRRRADVAFLPRQDDSGRS